MMQRGKMNLVIGGQWGSEAKGKLAGYLALRDRPYGSVCNFMTNAGHYFQRGGERFLVQQLPMAAVCPDVKLYISAGSAITLDTLFAEIFRFEQAGISVRDRLMIDQHAVIIGEEYRDRESRTIGRISSTLKGCGEALADKVRRSPSVKLAKDSVALKDYIGNVAEEVQYELAVGNTFIGELAQGFDLSLNHGTTYPFVTSRDITPMAFMSDCGLPSHLLGDVYAVLRTYPIRVGNVYNDGGERIGYSGDVYSDQEELSWERLSTLSGKTLLEYTTVTKKVRRVFTFSYKQIKRLHQYCAPNKLMLNFVNYFKGIDEKSTVDDMMMCAEFTNMERKVCDITGLTFDLIGTGAENDAMLDMER